MIVQGNDSWMFQIPGTSLVERQAELCGCDWLPVVTKGMAEEEVGDLKLALLICRLMALFLERYAPIIKKHDWKGCVEDLKIKSFTPLWHQSSQSHMENLVSNGFKVMITGVSSDGLGKEWLGCILDKSSLERLRKLASKYRFHVDGEEEYETVVVAGPHMKGELSLDFDIEWDGVRGQLNFL